MSKAEHLLQEALNSFRLAFDANEPKEIKNYVEMIRRLGETSTIALNTKTVALCPKCGREMVLKAILPHPIIAGIKRYAYVCPPCDRARTYYLPNQPSQLRAS